MSTHRMMVVAAALALAGCDRGRYAEALAPAPTAAAAPEGQAASELPAEQRMMKLEVRRGAVAAKMKKPASISKGDEGGVDLLEKVAELAGSGGLGKVAVAPAAEPAAPGPQAARAWFPETFLFEPLVVTDASGRATVPVRVPDRLTSWRVLALAHSRAGEQAGAVASFRGTLPTYVDPVVPSFLVAGDEVRIPVQVVNTTAKGVSGALQIAVSGASLASPAPGEISVAPNGTEVRFVTVLADRPGTATLRASFAGLDAVMREIPIQPSGRPLVDRRGGTLGAPRVVEIDEPSDAPAGTARVRLSAFPGALALVRSELSNVSGRAALADDAYGLLLAGEATSLLQKLGDKADPDAVRSLTILMQQRALADTRSADVSTAALFVEGASAQPDNPVLSRLAARLAATIAQGQRPDGTFQGGDGWTLQRLLVTTAECTRAVRASARDDAGKIRARAVAVRASGAFERFAPEIKDGYTAAAVLSSGAVQGTLAERLRAVVKGALQQGEGGARYLPVERGIVRGDGSAPSTVEATALAVLGLEGDKEAPLADLGTTLLGAYSPERGWGDGHANLSALSAAVHLFKDPVPSQVRIVLELDGKTVAEGVLGPDKLKEVLTVEAPVGALSRGKHLWRVRADPAVAGLGFQLARYRWLPWTQSPPENGIELAAAVPAALRVGQPATIQLSASSPGALALEIRAPLAAGVQPDRSSLTKLQESGAITGFRVDDSAVTLEVPPRPAGQPFAASFQVIPTLAGTLHTAAFAVSPQGDPGLAFYVPPKTWSVASGQ